MTADNHHRFTVQIIIALLLGIVIGVLLRWLPLPDSLRSFIVLQVLHTVGTIFIRLLTMMVVPIVFVSLVLGCTSLTNVNQFGRIGGKTCILYLFTTALAVALALVVAQLLQIGAGLHLSVQQQFNAQAVPSVQQVITGIVPTNPFDALVTGHMLQVIFFALFFGMVMASMAKTSKGVINGFSAVNDILIKMILVVIKVAPYGVFCLLAELFAKQGFSLIEHLLGYFMVVLLVLAIQLFAVYSTLIAVLGRLSPLQFFRKLYPTLLFAFSVSSSNACIPVTLRAVHDDLGVANKVASFIIPLGATVNMDGTAIMQGVATVFIAHAFHIAIGWSGYLTVIAMATLASIGTAGVPSVGLITLAMVLKQVGLPVQGIALIIGIDRLLDMARTAVNIAGDSMIAVVVGKSENALSLPTYQAEK